nr:zinc-binding alcohol dehydrogenase family protein [Marinobacterium profundum]
MKAVVCLEPGLMEARTVEKPVPGKGEVLIRVKRVGVCGTDIHAFSGSQPYFQYPRVLGHELAGVIEAVGEDADFPLGVEAYVIPYLECGNCVACRQGKTNCCTRMQVMGVHLDGGMCEYLVVPADHVIKAPGLELDQLALVECLAIGAHAVRRADVQPGSTVLVVGAGPIGMGIMQFAKARGARVLVIDTNAERLGFCKDSLGVDAVIEAGDGARAQLESLTDGDYPHTVFDATGNPKAMMAGFDWIAHGGSYVLVSVVKADITFSDPEFHKRELSLLGSRNATREDFERVVSCLLDGSVQASAMITHRGHLSQLAELFPLWVQPSSGVIKAVVEVG